MKKQSQRLNGIVQKCQSLVERKATDFERGRLLVAAAVAGCQSLDHMLLRDRSHRRHRFFFVSVYKLEVFLSQQARYDRDELILYGFQIDIEI